MIQELIRQTSMHIGKLFGYGGVYYCIATLFQAYFSKRTFNESNTTISFLNPNFIGMLVTSLGLFCTTNYVYYLWFTKTYVITPSYFSLFVVSPIINYLCIVTWHGAFFKKSVLHKKIAYDPFYLAGLGCLALAGFLVRLFA